MDDELEPSALVLVVVVFVVQVPVVASHAVTDVDEVLEPSDDVAPLADVELEDVELVESDLLHSLSHGMQTDAPFTTPGHCPVAQVFGVAVPSVAGCPGVVSVGGTAGSATPVAWHCSPVYFAFTSTT